jgi:uncharacterized protein
MTPDTPQEEILKRDSLLEFPCRFPIKAMGHDKDDFETLVKDLVLNHAVMFEGEQIKTNLSSSGTYLAVTVTIEATSRDQLDRIYQDLTACERVLMAL